MKIPGAARAVVDIAKLRDYCLNPAHLRGRHKARIFFERLGLTIHHAEDLRQALLSAVREHDATAGNSDRFGDRYVIQFSMSGPSGTARVLSAWIVRRDEDFPRLTSCYVA